MTAKKRKILFFSCLCLFLLLAPSAVLYTQGYRFDSQTKRITQTGGIFLKTWPKQANVYIDGKIKDKTDFFFGSVLIENLLPRPYKVEIRKDGFYPWKKTLDVAEKQVSEAKNVILFPQNPQLSPLAEAVNDAWFVPDEKQIILLKESKGSWFLEALDLQTNATRTLIAEKDVSTAGAELINVSFPQKNNSLLIEANIQSKIKYFSLDLGQPSAKLQKAEKPQLAENIYDDYKFSLLDGILYLYNKDQKKYEKFFEQLKGFELSPDSKKIAYFSDNEIWTVYLENTNEEVNKKAGENSLLIRLSEKITDCLWLDSNHVAFNANGALKISELDTRDRLNIVDLAQIKNAIGNRQEKIFWNGNEKRMYILTNNILSRSAILVP